MGGDFAPHIVLKGANIARLRYPQAEFVFFGDENKINPLIKSMRKLQEVSKIVHTDSVIPTDMKPSYALRREKTSSMRLAVEAVKNGEADCVVSAGNTGALMVISQFVLRNLPGIQRSAMASFMPSLKGEVVVLDLGANVDCQENHLVQFAVMGSVFSQIVCGYQNPRVGLLNVGSEDGKGNDILKSVNKTLKSTDLPGSYYGFIEGNHIMEGLTDVVVTDGFTGNIALKVIEGSAKLSTEFIRQGFKNSFFAKVGYLFAKQTLKKLWIRLDPRRYNGAVLLGVNGIVVKSHGGTDALGFATALGVSIDMAANNYNELLIEKFQALKTA